MALAPVVAAPEPGPATNAVVVALVAILALFAVVACAIRMRNRLATRPGDVAALLIVISVIASLVGGFLFRGANAPLGRGLFFVAIPLWAGLATSVYAALAKRAPDKPQSQHVLPALAIVTVAAIMLGASIQTFRSRERSWWATIKRDGDIERAVLELTGEAQKERNFEAVLGVLDQCVASLPSDCICLIKRSETRIVANDTVGALVDAQSAVARCSSEPAAQAALAMALCASGDAPQAEAVARKALATSDARELHYALAVALDRLGRTQEALASARRAVELLAGRDAELFLGALLIRENDLDGAAKVLSALVAKAPNDADALYDLALIADKRSDYNKAREGYLAALRANPKLANARYNLALLTARYGVFEEARYHAKKFSEALPGDPRYMDLVRKIEVSAAAAKK